MRHPDRVDLPAYPERRWRARKTPTLLHVVLVGMAILLAIFAWGAGHIGWSALLTAAPVVLIVAFLLERPQPSIHADPPRIETRYSVLGVPTGRLSVTALPGVQWVGVRVAEYAGGHAAYVVLAGGTHRSTLALAVLHGSVGDAARLAQAAHVARHVAALLRMEYRPCRRLAGCGPKTAALSSC